MSADVTKDNIASLAEKVDVDEFQRVILDRLNEVVISQSYWRSPGLITLQTLNLMIRFLLPFWQAYLSGLSDQQVQLLGSISRVATIDDMSKWNISTSDTLAALMNSDDGEWEAEKVNEKNEIRDGFLLLTNVLEDVFQLTFVFVWVAFFQSRFIVTKFLSGVNNSLGSTELNVIGGPSLCSLDTNTLSNINSDSIK